MKLEPLRILIAVAPSGGEIRFIKYTESKKELCFYHGLLTSIEDQTWWKAKLAAEKSGVGHWEVAKAILVSAGWQICSEEAEYDTD